jgi:amino acid transporter
MVVGTVLFVRKMGECLVFITTLFVTLSAIVVVGAMSDRTGFAKSNYQENYILP